MPQNGTQKFPSEKSAVHLPWRLCPSKESVGSAARTWAENLITCPRSNPDGLAWEPSLCTRDRPVIRSQKE